MMIPEKRPNSAINTYGHSCTREAGCLYALITGRRSVSRRNRASWYLRQLNKSVVCDPIESLEEEDNLTLNDGMLSPDLEHDDTGRGLREDSQTDIHLVSITASNNTNQTIDELQNTELDTNQQQFLVTPNTRVLFLSKSIASSIVIDLSPSVVSVSSQNGCVFLDSMFDALKRVLHLLVKSNEIPASPDMDPYVLSPKVFVSVIAYTPFVVAKNNQVLVQHRRISSANIDQVLVEIWICLNRLTQEIYELVGNTCGMNLEFDTTKTSDNVFVFPQPIGGGVIRHPEIVLEDIYNLGLFSSSLMPRLSRLSMIIISDGLFASTNNLSVFRLKSIAVSFVSLGSEAAYPDACFGYTPYVDLMKFIAKTTQGVYLSHQDLINSSHSLSKNKQVLLSSNPFYKLVCWTLHSDKGEDLFCDTPRATNFRKFDQAEMDPIEINPEHIARFFCVDQPLEAVQSSYKNKKSESREFSYANSHNYHDWRSFRQLDRNLDADFEQVLSCLLREGYLIKNIHFKHKETSWITARLVLHWRHNLDLEQELTAPYWSNTDPFDMSDSNQLIMRPSNTPRYGDTYCEIIVHGSYSFLHNLYCDRRSSKRRSEYRDVAYRQFRQLIDGVLQTHERLQYLSRFYSDSSLSKVPSFLLHGNSLLYEQPHTHKLTSTIENVMDETKTSEFQEYWQKISCLETKSWKNLMHIHTLRLVLEHDQPKHKNIHCQNANGRYTQVQCRRALSGISTFIKSYSSFALLEDTTYVKFIYNNDDDLREIETSATKGFIVIRINKLLPILVINLMFTSGILDSHRVQIVSYLEEQLKNCKLRNVRPNSTIQIDNILKSKTISPSSESCCALIKSPLEDMLRVYDRNFLNECLIHNWAHGLPGACPYTIQHQPLKVSGSNNNNGDNFNAQSRSKLLGSLKNEFDSYTTDYSLSHYNLVFGKYLYAVRVVQTMTNLPHDIVPSLAANVISKISATLVNIRIKQGFHIGYNNSGMLNLIVELLMKDHSNEDHASSCLCQYLVFPPVITNLPNQIHNTVFNNNNNTTNNNNSNNNISTSNAASSKPGSLNGSLANSDSYMKNATSDSANPHMRGDNGEIKMIREYWIEQQYGISSSSQSYHKSLEDMRYSEVVDHLFLTDSSIFECLLTYELLQLLCDKLSLYYNLDSSLARSESKTSPLFSPTTSTTSSNLIDQGYIGGPSLPSTLIEGNTKNGNSRVPLLELEYRFSIMKFLDHCQQGSLNVLLFKDYSEFFGSSRDELNKCDNLVSATNGTNAAGNLGDLSCGVNHVNQTFIEKNQHVAATTTTATRKMSVDINEINSDHSRRGGHRSSYQQDNFNTTSSNYLNPIYSPSLNHMFLETLHKRLKQMHDKEVKLSDYDRKRLPVYLKRRCITNESSSSRGTTQSPYDQNASARMTPNNLDSGDELFINDDDDQEVDISMDWRCFLRKGNQENLMIVLIPATLSDIVEWLNFVNCTESTTTQSLGAHRKYDPVCPIFVFRCSSTMISDHVLSFLKGGYEKNSVESDLWLHFGQPCNYLGRLRATNDELTSDIDPLTQFTTLPSDEKTLEIAHFRAFLRKIKNTVLKSRFSSLNDAYLSELFINKDDILYYINNVDLDTQKKYHVSSQLKNLTDFIKNYEEYNDSLPKEPKKPCNQLLNSILLQKCGLFINQPIARFNESNPLIKQLHDKKLLFLMRCNYKVELPLLEENLAGSTLLRQFIKPSNSNNHNNTNNNNPLTTSSTALSSSINESLPIVVNTNTNANNLTSSSLSKSEGTRLMEMKCGSVGATGNSPSAVFVDRAKVYQAPRFSSSSSTLSSIPNSANESFILEAFRGSKSCSIKELSEEMLTAANDEDNDDLSWRHEAHMAEVLKRSGERKESHHYRRVLKSKGNYNQSHSAIDQALKRVDSLGRLEHFCLTPLLFSPSWRSKLAPVRDHTISAETSLLSGHQSLAAQQEAEDRWHQMVCNNYIKEYEQYIQTLGFNSVQIRYQTNPKGSATTSATSSTPPQQQQHQMSTSSFVTTKSRKIGRNNNSVGKLTNSHQLPTGSSQNTALKLRRGSLSTSNNSLPFNNSSMATCNTGYLIKFLNSGCLVFKVGFCKPYVYSILYSIEGERFNNSNAKMNMTTFLDELDNIKVIMHLHSFTYDYHLRSIYSYISGRQLTFSPGYHLISFLDDFRKYYQKAPNYARNHILSGEVHVIDLKVTGQQLYNYIVTHNSTYSMEVLEMSAAITNIITGNLSSRLFIENHAQQQQQQQQLPETKDTNLDNNSLGTRSHANDYVLIELKREKVRYRDGKDPDIFDCGLLITHDVQNTDSSKNSLTLKYFLLLTNQRDLYPKLIHTYDNIISLGCHRPIRFGMAELKPPQPQVRAKPTTATVATTTATATTVASTTTAPSSGQSDQEDVQSSELQSSGEVSGPQSIISTANSVQSSNSGGLQFGLNQHSDTSTTSKAQIGDQMAVVATSVQQKIPNIRIEQPEDGVSVALKNSTGDNMMNEVILESGTKKSAVATANVANSDTTETINTQTGSSIEENNSSLGEVSPASTRKQINSPNSSKRNSFGNVQERTICDEEITYLGYFSSDEMDMLRFLREKTANLRMHIEQVVRSAEIHYRRDYLWHKLMQRTSANAKCEDMPLTTDELVQLLGIVEAIDLASLDPQLSVFTAMHINWYLQLLKAFADLRQSSLNLHKIYTVKASPKIFLLYIDPKCTTSFILLTLDPERCFVELNMLLKNKQECSKIIEKTPTKSSTTANGEQSTLPATFELDQDCQQLINDFINFCATFMWSTLLT